MTGSAAERRRRLRERERLGELAIAAMTCQGVIYEFWAEDVLSFATQRWTKAHPVLTRVIAYALVLHLVGDMPYQFDMFDARNLVHRGIVAGVRWLRAHRRPEVTGRSTRSLVSTAPQHRTQ